MPVIGPELQPRDIAALADEALAGLSESTPAVVLAEAVAICLAESQGGVHSYHDNLDADQMVTSRDVGLWQINIPASAIGSPVEMALYEPITNAKAMAKLHEGRGWQPWASFNETTYLYDSYLGRAVRGVGNYLGDQLLNRPAVELDGTTPYVHSFKTPVLDYWFRVEAGVAGCTQAEAALGWGAKSKSQVTLIHQNLAAAVTAAKQPIP